MKGFVMYRNENLLEPLALTRSHFCVCQLEESEEEHELVIPPTCYVSFIDMCPKWS